MSENVANVSEEGQPAEVDEAVEETTSEPGASDQDSEVSGEEDADTGGEEEPDEDADSTEAVEEEPVTPAQKRIQELANERRKEKERADALEARLAAIEERNNRPQPEPVVDVVALNNHLGKMREDIDFLRLDGKHLEADIKEQERLELIREYNDWNRANQERQVKMKGQQEQTARRMESLQRLDRAAVAFAEQNKIPQKVFEEMGVRFRELAQTDKVFASQVLETLELQGPTRAAIFVHDHLVADAKARKAKAEAEKLRRDTGKDAQQGVKANAPGKPLAKGLSEDLPMEIWLQRRNAQLKKK